ncbi:class F sortase [Candidatus Saccharibacteria bacterium]|nr:class F sortase [Candidatus Saccharibacteria bacterium]
MKRLVTLSLSIFLAFGLVVSGGLYDVYAEHPDYQVKLASVSGPDVRPQKSVPNVKQKPEPEERALINQPIITTAVPMAQPIAQPQNAAVDMSNHLEIPGIGVYRAVQTVGLNNSGEIDVPSSNVGLWNGGAQPGQNGVVFLDGHVFGVFANLKNTSVGSIFSLTWGGVVYHYRVADVQTYSLSQLNQTSNGIWSGILYKPVGGAKGLNIMTCAGQPQGNTYSHRTVVYAYQVN